MKILIAVPSKNRVLTLKKNTWAWLQLIVKIDYKIFVEPQDHKKYCLEFGEQNIVSLDDNDQGLGYAKNFIKNYAVENGYDLIFKLDDDVRGWTDLRVGGKTEKENADNFCKMFKMVVPMFDDYDNLGAVSFPYGNELYDISSTFVKTKRLQTSYFVRTKFFAVDPAIQVFEDFATGLNILVNNALMVKYCKSAQVLGVKVGGGTGGHQSFDRHAQAMKEVELLRAIYPPLKFRPVEKPWAIEPDIKSIKLG